MKSARAPIEPRDMLARIEPGSDGFDVARLWALLVRLRMRAAGMSVPDQVFGLAWSGALDSARIRGLIEHLPDGLTEIYTHPATDDHYPTHAPGYAYRAELAALLDPLAREAISRDRITLGELYRLRLRSVP